MRREQSYGETAHRFLFMKTHFIFHYVCRGSRDFDISKSIEDNVSSSVPMLLQMLKRGEVEGFDGFVLEVRKRSDCGDFNSDVHEFAEVVSRVLCTISDMDPTGEKSVRKSYIHDKAWHFVFAGFPIFVTTFSPCYSSTSSRYVYGADQNSAFILLQPEYSFLRHDLPPDTASTNWENPSTIRDRIRVSFLKAGQGYDIPYTIHYPASEHIVKPLKIGDAVVRWWEFLNIPKASS